MRFRYLTAVAFALVSAAFALDRGTGIHAPSTIIQCNGEYHTFSAGVGCMVPINGGRR
jgi:hypothetical protein